VGNDDEEFGNNRTGHDRIACNNFFTVSIIFPERLLEISSPAARSPSMWNSIGSCISRSTSERVAAAATQPATSGEYAEYPECVSSTMIRYRYTLPLHGSIYSGARTRLTGVSHGSPEVLAHVSKIL